MGSERNIRVALQSPKSLRAQDFARPPHHPLGDF